MRSLLNNLSDRFVGMVVPKVTAQAAACSDTNCGCSWGFRLKNRCCVTGTNVVCTGCVPRGFC